MSKAEERAFERCPKSENAIEEMRNERKRAIFTEGYRQAEKDLELTWEDLATIEKLCDDFIKHNQTPMGDEEFYKEILKQFKNYKEKEKREEK
jgi:hypothetical protein